MKSHNRRKKTEQQEQDGMHICINCGSNLVDIVTWEEYGEWHWKVELFCPECQNFFHGIFPEKACLEFDEVLNEAEDQILKDYKKIVRANMEREIEVFVEALNKDQILPEDF